MTKNFVRHSPDVEHRDAINTGPAGVRVQGAERDGR
jgi:hypothetical protein